MVHTFQLIAGIAIFVIAYFFIASEKINKTIVVLLAGGLVMLLHIISQEAAFEEIDFNVIFLLVGMMVIVSITKESGIFQYLAIKSAKIAKGNPLTIMILFSILTGVLSAFLDNVTTVLLLTPVTLLIAIELGVDPIPFVIIEIISSNLGGAATLIGDPPNLMIGSAADKGFLSFLTNLAPIVIINYVILIATLVIMFRGKFHVSIENKAKIMEFNENKSITDITLLKKSMAVLGFVILGFLLHEPLEIEAATIAIFGAAVLMLITKTDPEEIFKEVEWATIFFFVGLFIMVGALVELGVIRYLGEQVLEVTQGDIPLTASILVWLSGIASSIFDNIPYVATMIPLVKQIKVSLMGSMGSGFSQAVIDPLWWSLALGSCIGGNGTAIGASANVIAIGISKKNGYNISFVRFLKYGAFFTVQSLIIMHIYIWFRYLA